MTSHCSFNANECILWLWMKNGSGVKGERDSTLFSLFLLAHPFLFFFSHNKLSNCMSIREDISGPFLNPSQTSPLWPVLPFNSSFSLLFSLPQSLPFPTPSLFCSLTSPSLFVFRLIIGEIHILSGYIYVWVLESERKESEK